MGVEYVLRVSGTRKGTVRFKDNDEEDKEEELDLEIFLFFFLSWLKVFFLGFFKV